MTKNAARREKFKRIGHALSKMQRVMIYDEGPPPKLGDPDIPDYKTGRESKFKFVHGSSDEAMNPHTGESERLNEIHGIGPILKTPQWIRTVKQNGQQT